MEIIQSVILGAVQGLGEFLPISSSAHLILTPWFFGWKDQGLAFDVALHFGTLVAVLAYFKGDIWLLIKGFLNSLNKSTRDINNNVYQKLSWLILIATIPAAIIGKLLEQQAENALRSPLLIAFTLSVVGVALWLADKYGAKNKNLTHISWLNSLIIGLSQAAAIVPGVSRSGATMIAGLSLGVNRQDAAKFSFLMSIPIILGAVVLKLPEILHIQNHFEVIAGFASSAVFGFLAIKYMLKYISTRSFAIFTIYRLALAVVVLLVLWLR